METVTTNKALESTASPPITTPIPLPRFARGGGAHVSGGADSAIVSPKDTFLAHVTAQQRHQELQHHHHQPGKILRSVFNSIDTYQRETGKVWTKVGITPTNSSTQQCEEAIHSASLDDLRSVCLGAITTFNTLTQQLTALSKNTTSSPSINHFSSTTTSNNNYSSTVVSSAASWTDVFNNLVTSIVDRYDGMETAFNNTFISSATQEDGWGDNTPITVSGGGGVSVCPSPVTINKLQSPPLLQGTNSSSIFSNRQYSLAGGRGTVDDSNAQLESLPSFFLRESPSTNNVGVYRTTSTTSYTGRAPLQFTNNVATTDNDDGFTMINDYVILDELGSGSFGKVMLAFNTKDEKLVAIKGITKGPRLKNLDLQAVTDEVLMSLPMAERRRLQTIQSEIAVMKDLRHQNLVALHEVMDDPAHNQLYLVLQYVDDGVLANVGAGTMHPLVTSVTGLVSACRQIATGLEYLHRHRVLHRDLKPENVLVDTHGNVCIADFGVSESLANKHMSENMGTILFTAPELLDLRTSVANDANISGSEPVENSESGNLPRMHSLTLGTLATRPSIDTHSRNLSIPSTTSDLPVTLPPKRMSRSSVIGTTDNKKYAPDMWALGVMIYYLLYLRLPFESVDSIRNCEVEYPEAESTSWWSDTTDRQTGNPFTAEQLLARRAMVPEMEKLLRRLLEKDPAVRATANDARLALKAVARYIEDRSEEYQQQQEQEKTPPPPPLTAEPSTSVTPPEGIFADMVDLIGETSIASAAAAPSSTTSNRPFQPHYNPHTSHTSPRVVVPTVSALQPVVEPSIAQMESILNSVNNFRKQRGGQSSNVLKSSTSRRGSVQVPLLKSYKEGGGGGRPNNRNSVTTICSPKNSFYGGGGFGGFGGGEDIIDAQLVAAGMRVSTRMASIFRQTQDALLRRKSTPTTGSGCATTSMSGSPRPLHVSDLITREISSSPASTGPLNPEDVSSNQARSTSVTSTANNAMITPSPSLPTPNSIINTNSIFTPPSSILQQHSSSSSTANKFTTANAQYREQQQQQKQGSGGGTTTSQKGNHPTAFISRIKRVSKELDVDVLKGVDQEESEPQRPNKFNDIREAPNSPLIALTHKPPSSPNLRQMKRGTGYVRTGPMVSSTSSGGSFCREDSSSSPYVLQTNKKA